MAKRRRLDVSVEPVSGKLDTNSAASSLRARMPIAEVAGDTAGRAALEEVVREMTRIEEEGRVVKKLTLDCVQTHHFARDRMELDEEEMHALRTSIAERGQQTPIEVLPLRDGKYGLISGLRRMEALRSLNAPHVLALVRRPESSQDAYRAMVEENEIRTNLSFYERANIAVEAVGQGVFANVRAAVKGLFAHAPKARRSKILKFVSVCTALGESLRFPTMIPEHLGLALAHAIEADPKLADRIASALAKSPPDDAAEERRVLELALKRPARQVEREKLAPNLVLERKAGRAVLSGRAVDEAFLDELRSWAISHAKL